MLIFKSILLQVRKNGHPFTFSSVFNRIAPIVESDFGLEIEWAADPALSMLRPDDKSAATNADAANNAVEILKCVVKTSAP